MGKLDKKDILVVYKKSRYVLYRERSKQKKEELKQKHEQHKATLKQTRQLLKGATFIYRASLCEELVNQHKLIVTVGGDGTLLDASHFSYSVPLLGINSTYNIDESGSEGFFCGATRFNLENIIDKLFNDKLESYELNRIQLELNGKRIKPLVLNEARFQPLLPGAAAYYKVRIDGVEDLNPSDGWVFSTAAGSTGLPRSYDKKIMPIESKEIQYFVLGAMKGRTHKPKLFEGIINTSIEVVSNMRKGCIAIDGRHNTLKLNEGDKLKLYSSEFPLLIYNMDVENREKNYS